MWSVNIGKYMVFRFIVASDYDVMVWYGTVWYGMVWYGMVWYGPTKQQEELFLS